jgi:hypothetical protein
MWWGRRRGVELEEAWGTEEREDWGRDQKEEDECGMAAAAVGIGER